MRIGKLTSSELQKYVFDKTVAKNPEILQSAGLAEDCAALRTPKILLLTTDPITATGNNAGRLAITVSANDVAVSGGTPLCCLLTIIAPTTASAEDVGKFMKEAHETAEALGVDIVGGHTEFSEAVNRMVVSCTMLGTTRRIVKSSGAKAGDSIVMTKSAAIEATAIMANDHADKLLKNGLTTEELVEAREYIAKVSVVEDAKIVWKQNVSCMHDVTEGGVFRRGYRTCGSVGAGRDDLRRPDSRDASYGKNMQNPGRVADAPYRQRQHFNRYTRSRKSCEVAEKQRRGRDGNRYDAQ